MYVYLDVTTGWTFQFTAAVIHFVREWKRKRGATRPAERRKILHKITFFLILSLWLCVLSAERMDWSNFSQSTCTIQPFESASISIKYQERTDTISLSLSLPVVKVCICASAVEIFPRKVNIQVNIFLATVNWDTLAGKRVEEEEDWKSFFCESERVKNIRNHLARWK